MGLCSSAKAGSTAESIPPEEGRSDSNGSEVEASAPNGIKNNHAIENNSQVASGEHDVQVAKRNLFGSAALAVSIASRRKKLSKLPEHVSNQLSVKERNDLEIMFATHARHDVIDGDEEATFSTPVMRSRGLAQACSLPYAHLNIESTRSNSRSNTDSTSITDLFANKLLGIFTGSTCGTQESTLGFTDFVASMCRLRDASPQEQLDFICEMFSDENLQKSPINDRSQKYMSTSEIVRVTLSMLKMASLDDELQQETHKLGLDYFDIDIDKEQALREIIGEWVSESFGKNRNEREKTSESVSYEKVKAWYETIATHSGSERPYSKPKASKVPKKSLGPPPEETISKVQAIADDSRTVSSERASSSESYQTDVNAQTPISGASTLKKSDKNILTGLELSESSDDDQTMEDAIAAVNAAKAATEALEHGAIQRNEAENLEISAGGTGYV